MQWVRYSFYLFISIKKPDRQTKKEEKKSTSKPDKHLEQVTSGFTPKKGKKLEFRTKGHNVSLYMTRSGVASLLWALAPCANKLMMDGGSK